MCIKVMEFETEKVLLVFVFVISSRTRLFLKVMPLLFSGNCLIFSALIKILGFSETLVMRALVMGPKSY